MKIRNILNAWKSGFNREPFINGFIVEDTTTISSAQDRAYAVDENLVISTHFELIDACNAKGWLYEVDFAKANTVAAIRDASDGFDSVIKAILSGVSKRYDNQIQADISTAALQ